MSNEDQEMSDEMSNKEQETSNQMSSEEQEMSDEMSSEEQEMSNEMSEDEEYFINILKDYYDKKKLLYLGLHLLSVYSLNDLHNSGKTFSRDIIFN